MSTPKSFDARVARIEREIKQISHPADGDILINPSDEEYEEALAAEEAAKAAGRTYSLIVIRI